MTGIPGSWTAFDAARFRDGIRFAMTMGEPPAVADRVSFRWNPTTTTAGPASGDGVPFDPAQAVTSTTPAPAYAKCVYEFVDAAGEPTPFGSVVPSKVRIWMLDVDYPPVATADYVMISGDRYERIHEQPSYAMFDVAVRCLLFGARNET